jgi:ABC-2 type transport system ATP-binding protein
VARLGVVFGQRTQLWWDLPVIESFELLAEIYRLPPAQYRETLADLTALFCLEPFLNTPVRQLSLGQRVRCDLAAALLHRPGLLFLDEPTIGLDAPTKLAVRDTIRRLNRDRGVTILLTTHDLDDIEQLCRRILVINQGKLVLDGSLEDLLVRVGRQRLMIIDLDENPQDLAVGGATVLHREGHRVTLRFDPAETSAAELIASVTARHRIRDLMVQNPPIEELIARFYAEVQG